MDVCMDPLVDTKQNWLYVYAITAVLPRILDSSFSCSGLLRTCFTVLGLQHVECAFLSHAYFMGYMYQMDGWMDGSNGWMDRSKACAQ